MYQDKIESFKGNFIQHGHCNDRIYLMRYSPVDNLPEELINLANLKGYSKIFAKVPERALENFIQAGFIKEAVIPAFYSGLETAFFLGYYLTSIRKREDKLEKIENILTTALNKKTRNTYYLDNSFTVRKCNKNDIPAMVKIYKKVFASYPFPVFNPEYIAKTMESHVIYFGIEINDKLVAISSAEIDYSAGNAEMTDFATLPDWRRKGFAFHLLSRMEKEIKKKNIKTVFTIARSISLGMNITFSKSGYQYCGRLKNNTNISEGIESMNVWYKLF